MWFGKSKRGTVVFALPGNPVSSFLCVNRYVLPYLKKSLGLQSKMTLNTAILTKDTASNPSLTLFTQASLETDKKGKLLTTPLSHHGSGDFIGVAGADVFVELPPQKGNYTKAKKISCCQPPHQNKSGLKQEIFYYFSAGAAASFACCNFCSIGSLY